MVWKFVRFTQVYRKRQISPKRKATVDGAVYKAPHQILCKRSSQSNTRLSARHSCPFPLVPAVLPEVSLVMRASA